MNCFPVIEMEMRSACRRKWTFRPRLLFALAGMGACLVVMAQPTPSVAAKGQAMLMVLSFLSLVFCLASGGLLTADCVSSEKRDGTLGLLFLTPLTGMDIVLGKMVCRGLQVFYGLCAVFPVFFLPLLTGGVTWAEVSRIVLALALALFFSASVGMLVSVLGTESKDTVMTTLASVALAAAVPLLWRMARHMVLSAPSFGGGVHQLSPVFTLTSGFDSHYRTRHGPALFWGSFVSVLGASLALLMASGRLTARAFHAAEEGRARRRARAAPPAFTRVFEQRPYEWVVLRGAREARMMGGLIVLFLGFFLLALMVALASRYWQQGFLTAFLTAFAVHLAAKLRFAVEATRQIHTDARNGAMELLLATPLPERGMVEGYQLALRAIGRKPVLVLVAMNVVLELSAILFSGKLHIGGTEGEVFATFFLGGAALAGADFCALRWLGLWYGLRASSHVKAALFTFTRVVILPWVGIALAFSWAMGARGMRQESVTRLIQAWIVLCLVYDWLTVKWCQRRLKGRLRRLVSEGVGVGR